ncbi:hypothetical protein BDZ45DRAFT_767290 [Acephala macrosclerotiorum]|nr:hypothetical protein BDZ45DRAFT_767290 [Acephala macrosclerotiorum]
MEAMAAFGVAGNVIQFLDFGQKLVSTSLEIYIARSGASTSNKEYEKLLQDFIESIDIVSENLLQYDRRLDITPPQASSQNGLQEIVDDCRSLAAKLLTRFEKLKLQRKPGLWKSSVRAVKCMWQESELVDLQKRLSRYQSQFEWRILLSLRQDVNLMADRQVDQFARLQASMTSTLSDAIRTQWENLPPWPISEVKEVSEANVGDGSVSPTPLDLQGISSKDSTHSLLVEYEQNATTKESIIQGTAHVFATKLAEMESEIWESLSFPIMTDREDEIADVELETFDWIFKSPRSENRPWDNFLEWLETGDWLYWISGKAGSGKSTLMKHLFNHTLTRRALDLWGGDMALITAGFFFWYSGGSLQKTQIGLLRSLLYQCLKNHRELITVVLSESARLKTTDLTEDWTFPRLKRAFTRLIHQCIRPLKICIFVDGLDEYQGDHSEITQLFMEVTESKNVKLCISSRPLLLFDKAFGGFPGLSLQNLTFDDINIYVKNHLGNKERMRELKNEEPELEARLTSEILHKAAGVFLWVKLVVHSLLEGLGNFDQGEDLERRLQELPNDLEDLHRHMLDRVKPAWYLEEGFRLILLVKHAHSPLTIRQLSFAEIWEPDFAIRSEPLTFTKDKQEMMCVNMAGRIKSRCLGLLEISSMAKTNLTDFKVQFLHKSVEDFLETPKVKLRISECLSGKGFDVTLRLMKVLLIELQHISAVDYLKREEWFDNVKPLIQQFISYAQYAEQNSEEAQVELMNALDRVAKRSWALVTFKTEKEELIHWFVAERRPLGADETAENYIQIHDNISTEAAEYDLRHYLRAKEATEALAYTERLDAPNEPPEVQDDSSDSPKIYYGSTYPDSLIREEIRFIHMFLTKSTEKNYPCIERAKEKRTFGRYWNDLAVGVPLTFINILMEWVASWYRINRTRGA